MKTILSTVIALLVLSGIAASTASAFDGKEFLEQQQRWSGH